MTVKKPVGLRCRYPSLVNALRLMGISDEDCYIEGAKSLLKVREDNHQVTIRAINEEISFVKSSISDLSDRLNSLEDIRDNLVVVLQTPDPKTFRAAQQAKLFLDHEVSDLFSKEELKGFGKALLFEPDVGKQDKAYDTFLKEIAGRSKGTISPALFDREVAYNWLVDKVNA